MDVIKSIKNNKNRVFAQYNIENSYENRCYKRNRNSIKSTKRKNNHARTE
jgi:hypothetical protein